MRNILIILLLFAATQAFAQDKITTSRVVTRELKSLAADSNVYVHDTLVFHDGSKLYSSALKTDSTNTATVNLTKCGVLFILAGSNPTTVNFPVTGLKEGDQVTIINNKVGSITVSAHRDLTGAFSVTQAAQTAVRYIYISGWKKAN